MRVLALFWLLIPSLLAGEWQQLSNCQLVQSNYNDGDSFHVSTGGKEYIFRLCYVDTPETKAMKEFSERTTEQAKYFGITKSVLFERAAQASALTKHALSQPFTVWTDGTDAKGNSQLPRHFGIIQTSQGDLAEILVKAGLSRVYGYSPNRPDGTTSTRYVAKLKEFEAKAFDQKAGAWAGTKLKSPPKRGFSSPANSARPSPDRSPTSETPEPSTPETSPSTEPINYVPAI